jgi:NAD(P)H-dependent FMN reductase
MGRGFGHGSSGVKASKLVTLLGLSTQLEIAAARALKSRQFGRFSGASNARGRGMSKLSVVIGSTRPGRVGLPIGQWFFEQAKQHGKFEVELVDLEALRLPLLDEPKHPRLGEYVHEHTKAWSKIVKGSDAFVFVTPEYNYSMPPALLNAIDYLFHEWAYKPAAFVSYGGQSGGMRSVHGLKQLLITLKVVGIPEAVTIPFFAQLMDNGVFKGSEAHEKSAVTLLGELQRWSDALSTLRA